MRDYDLVSVIIPTFNGSNFVERSIKSVLNQEYKNFELIIVDDNGKDSFEQLKTEEVIKCYKYDSRLHYIVHDVNKNGSSARNTGFFSSKGKFICLLDDDDEYYPWKIKNDINKFKQLNKNWGLVYCSIEKYVDNKFYSISKATLSGELLKKVLLHQVAIGSVTLMVRREVYEELGGFDETFKRHQDFEFTARLAAKYKVKAVSKVGVRQNVIGRNSPKSIQEAIKYRIYYIKKMLPIIKKFDKKEQEFIIYYNLIDFVGHLIKRGRIISAYQKCNKLSSPWIKRARPWLFIRVVIIKMLYKLKSFWNNFKRRINFN